MACLLDIFCLMTVRRFLPAASTSRRDIGPRRAQSECYQTGGNAVRWPATPARRGHGVGRRPELLFLDEPTTGFDPSARHQAWSVITRLRELAKTILLTTHYMEEAEALADRVVVIVAGRIVAEGTPEVLGGRDTAAAKIRFRRRIGLDINQLPALRVGHISINQNHVEIMDSARIATSSKNDERRQG